MDARSKLSSNELSHILEKQITLHRNLIQVLQEEFLHMSVLDTAGMAEAARSKEALLQEILNVESLRFKHLKQLIEKTAPGIRVPEPVAVSSLYPLMDQADSDRLKKTADVLLLLVTQAKELNSRNMGFTEASLVRIEEMKRNVLGLNNTGKQENYSNSGVREAPSEQGGRLLSTEA